MYFQIIICLYTLVNQGPSDEMKKKIARAHHRWNIYTEDQKNVSTV